MKTEKNGISNECLSAPPYPSRAGAVLCRNDSRFQPRSELFFHFSRDVFILDDSPFMSERRRAPQSRRSPRSVANEHEGSILAVGHRNSLNAPAYGGPSQASLGDCNHLLVFILNEHWRPGDRHILRETNADRIYKSVSHID